MSKIVMLRGLPGAGKTTYAKELVAKGGWVRSNKDDLRAMMDNGKFSKANEGRVIRIRNGIVYDAITNGNNVVVDDTNFAEEHEAALGEIAAELGADFEVKTIDTPLDVALKQNAARTDKDPVPEFVIKNMHERYVKPMEPDNTVDADGNELPEAILVDMDGTLSHIDPKNPRNVYDGSRAGEDLVDDAVASVAAMAYQNGYKVIIMTARKGEHIQVTYDWLKKHNINYDELYHRATNDRREDSIVKEELFNKNIKGKYSVKFVMDDRNRVVNMWRNKLGLKVFQVAEGDF